MAPISLNKEYTETEEGKNKWGFLSNIEDILFVAIFVLLLILFLYEISTSGFAISLKSIIILIVALAILAKFIVKFDEYERGVIFRFGKFEEVTGPGWKLILPLIERYARVDTRLRVYTTEPQEVVTKDGIRFVIGAAIFMHVSNPRDAVVNVKDYKSAVIHYVDGSLRSICGSSTSDYVVSHMDDISHTIKNGVNKLAGGMKSWGIMVPRIEMKYIQFPLEVQEAMHKKAIKDIESRLAIVNPADIESKFTIEEATLVQSDAKNSELAVVDTKKSGDTDTNEEVENYEKRIKEIKKRIGIDK